MDGVLLVPVRELAVDEPTIPDNHQKDEKEKKQNRTKKKERMFVYDISVL